MDVRVVEDVDEAKDVDCSLRAVADAFAGVFGEEGEGEAFEAD